MLHGGGGPFDSCFQVFAFNFFIRGGGKKKNKNARQKVLRKPFINCALTVAGWMAGEEL
jgi:hypothetical protein